MANPTWLSYVLVAVGGAIGSVARFAIQNLVANKLPDQTLYANAIINTVGSFLIGLFAGWIIDRTSPNYLLMAVGVLGGFTTFSGLSLDLLTLFQKGEWWTATLNAAAQIILGLLAAAIGFAITQQST
jgi:CrcB protein